MVSNSLIYQIAGDFDHVNTFFMNLQKYSDFQSQEVNKTKIRF